MSDEQGRTLCYDCGNPDRPVSPEAARCAVTSGDVRCIRPDDHPGGHRFIDGLPEAARSCCDESFAVETSVGKVPCPTHFMEYMRKLAGEAEAAPPRATTVEPMCWRCKVRPGLVFDGTTHECIACAGETARQTRRVFGEIDAALREGLSAWPRIMDRVEFVRECIQLHRQDAVRRA